VKKLLERGVTALASGRPSRAATLPANADSAPVGRGLQRFANTA
jgi:hypothetical protein